MAKKKNKKKGGFVPMDFLIVTGIAAVAYFLFSSFSRGPIKNPEVETPVIPPVDPNVTQTQTQTSSTGTMSQVPVKKNFDEVKRSLVMTYDPVQRRGTQGTEVKALQIFLKTAGYDIGPSGVDGDFGPSTLRALQQYTSDVNNRFVKTTLGMPLVQQSASLQYFNIYAIDEGKGKVYGANTVPSMFAKAWSGKSYDGEIFDNKNLTS